MRKPAPALPMSSFKVSFATKRDVGLLAAHRQKMWLDIHPEWREEVRESKEVTREWIESQLSKKRLVGFIVRTAGGDVAGSGCVWIREEQPRPTNPRMEAPYLMSMYTEKGFRRRGVATLVVKAALKWCRRRRYQRITLHASKAGRPVYEGLGFEPANEMRLIL